MDVVHLYLGPDHAEAAHQAVLVASALAWAKGGRLVLAARQNSSTLAAARAGGVATLALPGRGWLSLKNFRILGNALRRGAEVHLLHTHSPAALNLAVLLRYLGQVRFRLVATCYEPVSGGSWWQGERHNNADAVAAVNRAVAASLAGCADEAEGRVVPVIGCGLDLSACLVREGGGSRMVVGHPGGEGVQMFFQALAPLAGRVKALVFGAASCAVPEALAETVRCVGRSLGQRDLAGMDAVVAPDAGGQCGWLVKSAWAARVVLLAADTQANLELVTQGGDALVYNAGDAASLAARLGDLESRQGLRGMLAAQGEKRALEFADTAVAARYAELYRSLLRPKETGGPNASGPPVS